MPDEAIVPVVSSIGEPEKLKIFISYPREDVAVAEALREAILSRDRSQISVFLDQSDIVEGKEITATITEALSGAAFFIGIGTDAVRGQYSWCGVELGYFLALNKEKKKSVLCLYHNEIPDLFLSYRNTKIVSLSQRHCAELTAEVFSPESAPLRHLFKSISEALSKLNPPQDPSDYFARSATWALESSNKVTESYYECLQTRVKNVWYPQKRIEVQVPANPSFPNVERTVPPDASVLIDSSAWSLLNLGTPTGLHILRKSWSEFNRIMVEQAGGEHLPRIIAEVIFSVLPSKAGEGIAKASAQNDLVFFAPDQRRYRLILIKHQLYGNGRRDFVINCIETLASNFGGDSRTSALTAAVLLASKYRSIFLERDARYGMEKILSASIEDLALQTRQMLRDLTRINLEAAEEGMNDIGALSKLLGDTNEVRGLFETWWPSINALETSALSFSLKPTAEGRDNLVKVYTDFITASDRVNQRFMSLCLRAYQRIIDNREGL